MTFFGLQQGQDLENRAAHPHQEFLAVPPGELKTDIAEYEIRDVEVPGTPDR